MRSVLLPLPTGPIITEIPLCLKLHVPDRIKWGLLLLLLLLLLAMRFLVVSTETLTSSGLSHIACRVT
jgi:hypothetical protein